MLEVRDLSVALSLGGRLVTAVSGVSFTLAEGQALALVGESGCGKTLTALALTRLLPEGAGVSSGQALLDGVPLVDLPERDMCHYRGRRLAMIFQEAASALNPVMTLGDQIDEAIRLHHRLSPAETRARTVSWLRRVGIDRPEERARAFPFELSGGQRQRGLIAMALAAEPEVVIADEPTTALDVTLQAQIMALLDELRRERRLSLIIITHDLALVRGMADQVALMYAGQIVEQASCRDFFARPRHPYARALLAAVPFSGKRGRGLYGIAGRVPELGRMPDGCRFAERCPWAGAECRAGAIEPRGPASHQTRCLRAGRGRPRAGIEPPPEAPRPELGEPLLRISGLTVDYLKPRGPFRAPRRLTAVDGVSLSLRAGETLALVGESGSGKTTVGKAVLGLLDESARLSGEIALGDQVLPAAERRRSLAARRLAQMIFQDPFASLDPRRTVGDSVIEGMRALSVGADQAERRRRARELLDLVGLPADAAGRLPHEFSGGQRQRVAIARALAVEPRVIVCDEPTSALDVSVQAQIINLMRLIQRETGVGYLFITHNFGVVEYLADRVAVMRAGRIEESGPVEEVLSHPRGDYTRALLAAVPRLP